jgi:ABC-type uncharacterized transport system fused permease/ATPase subunit
MSKVIDKVRRRRQQNADAGRGHSRLDEMSRRITVLEAEVQECRRVNRRLSDVIDVVAELLVPALDRDDARVSEALARLVDET